MENDPVRFQHGGNETERQRDLACRDNDRPQILMRNAILAFILAATNQKAPVFGQYATVFENMKDMVAYILAISNFRFQIQPVGFGGLGNGAGLKFCFSDLVNSSARFCCSVRFREVSVSRRCPSIGDSCKSRAHARNCREHDSAGDFKSEI